MLHLPRLYIGDISVLPSKLETRVMGPLQECQIADQDAHLFLKLFGFEVSSFVTEVIIPRITSREV